jgi:hypothetical protein
VMIYFVMLIVYDILSLMDPAFVVSSVVRIEVITIIAAVFRNMLCQSFI